MQASILLEKSLKFAARIIKLNQYLIKQKHETIISKQIIRSGTSIGANANEAAYGNSKADFIAKMQIALKETAETEYALKSSGFWLRHSIPQSRTISSWPLFCGALPSTFMGIFP